ncbi:hypothetical protein [Fulvivirga lutimaris]|uniref:hypothetical protein n=1 Tax=Fulvivirga lutimaris TaxID=1819566 RepID=UPI0012BCEE93|nr:hypothetical protein [Fulvivirga lutimaris]MTI39825.1 hypothetical protein [Fulvivirga lutimaris]
MTNEEYSILILFGAFASVITLTLTIIFLLIRNDKPVNILFGGFFFEYVNLIKEKENKVVYSLILTLYILTIILVPISIGITMPSVNDDNCGLKRHTMNSQINKFITGKFIDKANHATPSFWVMQDDSTSSVYGLNNYWNKIYENAQAGDSLIKKSNSMTVTLRRNGFDMNFNIDIICEEKTSSNIP